jgi:hypothetical protein
MAGIRARIYDVINPFQSKETNMSNSLSLRCGSALIALAALPLSQTAAATSYIFQTLDYPGAVGTIFWGMNDFGDLAGQFNMTGKPGHAMVYRHGKFQSLDPNGLFGNNFSAAGGPNHLGTVFGGYTDASNGAHGFVIEWGRVQTVDFPNHLNSNVDGVNDFGEIAGVYWDADVVYHGIARKGRKDTPFDVPGKQNTYPLGINDAGDIVGYCWDSPASTHGFYRNSGGLIFTLDVPDAGPGGTAAFAINDAGQAAGYFVDSAGTIHGFVQTRGVYQTVDVPDSLDTIVTAMNNRGALAGEYFDTKGARHGFVATPMD